MRKHLDNLGPDNSSCSWRRFVHCELKPQGSALASYGGIVLMSLAQTVECNEIYIERAINVYHDSHGSIGGVSRL